MADTAVLSKGKSSFTLIIEKLSSGFEDTAPAEFSRIFGIEPSIARNIIKAIPIVFLQDVTRTELKSLEPKLLELSNRGFEFRITSQAVGSIPKVKWPIRPQFAIGESVPSGVAFEWENNAFICPGCGETFLFKKLGKLPLTEEKDTEVKSTAQPKEATPSNKIPPTEIGAADTKKIRIEDMPKVEVPPSVSAKPRVAPADVRFATPKAATAPAKIAPPAKVVEPHKKAAPPLPPTVEDTAIMEQESELSSGDLQPIELDISGVPKDEDATPVNEAEAPIEAIPVAEISEEDVVEAEVPEEIKIDDVEVAQLEISDEPMKVEIEDVSTSNVNLEETPVQMHPPAAKIKDGENLSKEDTSLDLGIIDEAIDKLRDDSEQMILEPQIEESLEDAPEAAPLSDTREHTKFREIVDEIKQRVAEKAAETPPQAKAPPPQQKQEAAKTTASLGKASVEQGEPKKDDMTATASLRKVVAQATQTKPRGELYNVYISGITDPAKRKLAAELIVQIKKIAANDADEMTKKPIIPLIMGIDKAAAEDILTRFKKLGISGRMTKSVTPR